MDKGCVAHEGPRYLHGRDDGGLSYPSRDEEAEQTTLTTRATGGRVVSAGTPNRTNTRLVFVELEFSARTLETGRGVCCRQRQLPLGFEHVWALFSRAWCPLLFYFVHDKWCGRKGGLITMSKKPSLFAFVCLVSVIFTPVVALCVCACCFLLSCFFFFFLASFS
ncbi:unnamed protein product [Ectocarpus sp. 6 AP-2014]